MISYLTALCAALPALLFVGESVNPLWIAVPAAAFVLGAVSRSLAGKRARPAFTVLFMAAAVYFIFIVYLLYGASTCVTAVIFAAAAGLTRSEGVRPAGNIMFWICVALTVACVLVRGEPLRILPSEFVPFLIYAGASTAAVSGAKPLSVCVSCVAGWLLGITAAVCGGVLCEIITALALFAVGSAVAASVISGFTRAYD